MWESPAPGRESIEKEHEEENVCGGISTDQGQLKKGKTKKDQHIVCRGVFMTPVVIEVESRTQIQVYFMYIQAWRLLQISVLKEKCVVLQFFFLNV